MIGGVQIDLLALNIILSIAILCLALAVGGGRLLPLVVVAAVQFWGLMKVFKSLHEDDEWWWEIARAQIALRVRRGWWRVRSNLMRVI